jgi:outer membrane lipoprotein carrier protein
MMWILKAMAALLLVPTGVSGGQDPEALAQRADRALAELTTLRTTFTQHVENPVLERTTVGRGTLTYRAPTRFRIAYSDPAGDVVVNDATHVWIYLPSSQPGQVIRQLAAASGVQNPLTFLRDLRGSYAPSAAERDVVAGVAADKLSLVPLGTNAPYTDLEVWVDRASGLMRQVRTRTAEGVTTRYTFENLEPNVKLAEAAFRFEVPSDAEIFDQ